MKSSLKETSNVKNSLDSVFNPNQKDSLFSKD